MHTLRLGALVLGLSLLCVTALAAPPAEVSAASGSSASSDLFAPLPLLAPPADEPAVSPTVETPEQLELRKLALAHERWRLQHWERVFDQQYVCSWIVFGVVIVLVLTGMWMSLMQFRRVDAAPAVKPATPPPPTEPTAAEETMAGIPAETDTPAAAKDEKRGTGQATSVVLPAPAPVIHEVSLDAKGLKVSSPTLGVVILALSLSFFFLYLKFVYQISVVDTEPKQAATGVSKEQQ
jgi:hypothetical protein